MDERSRPGCSLKGLAPLPVVAAIALLIACDDDRRGGPVYTLYRSASENERVHIATFDAAEPAQYNRLNCEAARDLFAGKASGTIRFWCERGRFRP
jgi:hypothetical protein